MPEQKRQIFREKSLEKLSSPDRLDQLLRIVKPQSWIVLAAFAAGLLLVLVWSVAGRIPATALGSAILVRPKQVVAFQSPASGRLASIRVAVGDKVAKGDLLATLHLPELQTQLEQERGKLDLFEAQSRELLELRLKSDQEMTKLERELAEQEKAFIAKQRTLIRERIETVSETAESYKQKTDAYLEQQRANIEDAKSRLLELGAELDGHLEAYRELVEKRTAAKYSVIEPRTRSMENSFRRAELVLQEGELELRENIAQQTYDERMDLKKDLEIQLNDLDIREKIIDRRLREDELKNRNEVEEIQAKNRTEIREIQARIRELEVKLETESQVLSEFGGLILEVTVAPGEQVPIGHRLGKMEIEDPGAKLTALVYFPIKDGKKVRETLKIRVSPSTVERERWGSMLGRVTSVSDYPVTTEAAANQIGDVEIAKSLLRGEARIEVMASLDLGPSRIDDCRLCEKELQHRHYAWTSGNGPDDVLISAGTTADARVTIEEVAPITLVLPFLKSLFDA